MRRASTSRRRTKSEHFDAPVLVRMTTRTSHSQGVVELGERTAHAEPLTVLDRDPSKNLMMPHNARPRHSFVEQRLLDIADWAETTTLNRVEMGDPRIGIVTSGAAYGSAREAFPGASFLKLGLTYPLPRKLIADFRAKVDKLYVVEELDPFLEAHPPARHPGGRRQGRAAAPRRIRPGSRRPLACGGRRPGRRARVAADRGVGARGPARPPAPTLCPGCSHRGVFVALRKMRAYVAGDIGCYSLGALAPFEAMHCRTCTGAGISMAHGMAKVLDETADRKSRPVAVIGDSTSSTPDQLADGRGLQPSDVLTIILDNRTTAMTGGQKNPGMGPRSRRGRASRWISLRWSVRSGSSEWRRSTRSTWRRPRRSCARSSRSASPRWSSPHTRACCSTRSSARRGAWTKTCVPAARPACAPDARR